MDYHLQLALFVSMVGYDSCRDYTRSFQRVSSIATTFLKIDKYKQLENIRLFYQFD